jgi:glucokinase
MEFLAGDVGGTKTALSIFSLNYSDGSITPKKEETYSSQKYSSFEDIVRKFIAENLDGNKEIRSACFGVAGPVIGGRAKMTNLRWIIDEKELSDGIGLDSVRVLNDLVATANYIPYLKNGEIEIIKQGEPPTGKRRESSAIAVIAPGTGLGEAFLTYEGRRWIAHASEGGHSDFAPTSEEQLGLLEYLQGKIKHVSYEMVCSGIGIQNIFSYFHETADCNDDDCDALSKIRDADDPTPIIIERATTTNRKSKCQACVNSIDTFVSILGAEASNLALKVLATDGIFIGGGLAPHLLGALKKTRFRQAFARKGRMSGLLSQIPVSVILTPRAALLGAARYGSEMAQPSLNIEGEQAPQVTLQGKLV